MDEPRTVEEHAKRMVRTYYEKMNEEARQRYVARLDEEKQAREAAREAAAEERLEAEARRRFTASGLPGGEAAYQRVRRVIRDEITAEQLKRAASWEERDKAAAIQSGRYSF